MKRYGENKLFRFLKSRESDIRRIFSDDEADIEPLFNDFITLLGEFHTQDIWLDETLLGIRDIICYLIDRNDLYRIEQIIKLCPESVISACDDELSATAYAVYKDNRDVFRLFLQTVGAKKINGPLGSVSIAERAIGLKRYEIIYMMLDAGVDEKDMCGAYNALQEAAANNDLALVKALVERYSIDPNETGLLAFPPIHISILMDENEIVDYLISVGADLNTIDAFGRKALDCASSIPMLINLLKHGAEKADENIRVAGLMYEGFLSNDKKRIDDSFNRMENINNPIFRIDNGEYDIFQYAVRFHRHDIVLFALSKGIDRSQYNNIFFHCFYDIDNKDINTVIATAQLLIDNGFSPAPNNTLGTAREMVAIKTVYFMKQTKESVFQLYDLLEYAGGEIIDYETFLKAAENFNIYLLEYCIAHGLSVRQLDEYSEGVFLQTFKTALKYGALSKKLYTDTAKLLIKNGADINRTDKNGNTVLHALASSFRLSEAEALSVLISVGADTSIRNISNQTAYDIAFEQGRPDNELSLLRGNSHIEGDNNETI